MTPFLDSGPAINVLAMVLTARVRGVGFAIAPVMGSVAFRIVVGPLMYLAFCRKQQAKTATALTLRPEMLHPFCQDVTFLATIACGN